MIFGLILGYTLFVAFCISPVRTQSLFTQKMQILASEFASHGYCMKGLYGNGIIVTNGIGDGNKFIMFISPLFGDIIENKTLNYHAFYFLEHNIKNDSIIALINTVSTHRAFGVDSTIDPKSVFVNVDSIVKAKITIVDEQPLQPKTFLLKQNYPNPFNPSTIVEYYSPIQSLVQIIIYDQLGKRIKLYENESMIGVNKLEIDLLGYSSGTYFCNVYSNLFSRTIRLNYLK